MPNLRATIYDRLRILSSPGVRRFIKNQPWFVPLSQRLFGNEVYSDSYYAGFALDQDATARARAAFQAADVIDYLAKPMIFRRGPQTP